jgi:hypothetical protein
MLDEPDVEVAQARVAAIAGERQRMHLMPRRAQRRQIHARPTRRAPEGLFLYLSAGLPALKAAAF